MCVCVPVCIYVCVCVRALSVDAVLCDCSGAGGGQARVLIGGQSLCILCQITAITRLLLLLALMTHFIRTEAHQATHRTHLRTDTHVRAHWGQTRQIGRGVAGLSAGRRGPPADGWRLKQTGDTCTQPNAHTDTHTYSDILILIQAHI